MATSSPGWWWVNAAQAGGLDTTTGALIPGTDSSALIGSQAARMKVNGFLPRTLVTRTLIGTALHTSTAATDILGTAVGGSKTLGAGVLNGIGRGLEFSFGGIIANTSTPNITFELTLGTTAILTTTATAMSTISGTSCWAFTGSIQTVTTGATGTVNGYGRATYADKAIAAPAVSGAAVTIDLTATQIVKCTVTWGTSSSSNTITCVNGWIAIDTANDAA